MLLLTGPDCIGEPSKGGGVMVVEPPSTDYKSNLRGFLTTKITFYFVQNRWG